MSAIEITENRKYTFKRNFLFLVFFRAEPATYGGSQARGQVRAAATDLHHNHTGFELGLQPTLQLK